VHTQHVQTAATATALVITSISAHVTVKLVTTKNWQLMTKCLQELIAQNLLALVVHHSQEQFQGHRERINLKQNALMLVFAIEKPENAPVLQDTKVLLAKEQNALTIALTMEPVVPTKILPLISLRLYTHSKTVHNQVMVYTMNFSKFNTLMLGILVFSMVACVMLVSEDLTVHKLNVQLTSIQWPKKLANNTVGLKPRVLHMPEVIPTNLETLY